MSSSPPQQSMRTTKPAYFVPLPKEGHVLRLDFCVRSLSNPSRPPRIVSYTFKNTKGTAKQSDMPDLTACNAVGAALEVVLGMKPSRTPMVADFCVLPVQSKK